MDKKFEALAVRPAAEGYLMFTKDELAGLAADNKANGLRNAITIGVLGEDRFIIDGRNRAKACEIAGVPPRYDEIVFETEDE
jgi:ParB-like chromosome segregation protein Spo0J